jgi:hypothetical protein
MTRDGHASASAVLVHQHSTSHETAIAASLDDLLRRHQQDSANEASGT